MRLTLRICVALLALSGTGQLVFAQEQAQTEGSTATLVEEPSGPKRGPWLDLTHDQVFNAVWRSAMYVDHLFGSQYPQDVYSGRVSGSITPALLWDEHDGFQPRFRFRANFPLPQLNDRFNLFIGRVDRNE